jgi:hypothetical protein
MNKILDKLITVKKTYYSIVSQTYVLNLFEQEGMRGLMIDRSNENLLDKGPQDHIQGQSSIPHKQNYTEGQKSFILLHVEYFKFRLCTFGEENLSQVRLFWHLFLYL